MIGQQDRRARQTGPATTDTVTKDSTKRATPAETLAAALRLAASGEHVLVTCWTDDDSNCVAQLPHHAKCKEPDSRNPGKAPLPSRGLDDATSDPEVIRRWLRTWPHANIAIAVGARSGKVALDQDDRAGGAKTMAELAATYPGLTDTRRTKTGNGWHYSFTHPGVDVKSPGHGVDVKGGSAAQKDTGYVMVAPSWHAKAQRRYEGPDDAPLAALPPGLIAAGQAHRAEPLDGEIPAGERHPTLISKVGSMRALGFNEQEILAALVELNKRCTPPKGEAELREIAAWVGQKVPGKAKEQRKSPATLLVELGDEGELFHAQDAEPYGTVPVNGHRETWPVYSAGYRDWLRRRYYEVHGAVPGGQAFGEALDLLAAKARFASATHAVEVRLAEHDGRIYLDLCNDDWQVVEVCRDGWDVVSDPPVRFRRARGMLALPAPTRGGSIDQLGRFINVGGDAWKLVIGWLLGLFRPGATRAAGVLSRRSATSARVSFTPSTSTKRPRRSWVSARR